jgi:hypothetical protein
MALVEGAPEMALDEEARVRLGALATTPPEVLKALVADASVTVRAAVALNPATPAYTNAALAADPDERVRALLARKLSAIAPSLSSGALNQLQQLTLDTLTGLAKDETVRVRAAIADAVKDLPDARTRRCADGLRAGCALFAAADVGRSRRPGGGHTVVRHAGRGGAAAGD